MTEFEQMDILQQALNRGIIDLTTIQQQVADMEREKILKMHPYKMWQDLRNLGILLMFETGIRIGELITFKFANPYKSRLCEADNGSRTRLSSLGS